MDLSDPFASRDRFTQANRPIRLRLFPAKGSALAAEDMLMVQCVSGVEAMCGDGIEYRLLCVSTQAGLPLKQFVAMPAEVQFVTAAGALRSVCGIVQSATEGHSDGGWATYELVMRDALAFKALHTNTRVFVNMSEVDIVQQILSEWRQTNPVLARTFSFDLSGVSAAKHPARAFTMQANESDSQFIRRLLSRRGIAWFTRPGPTSNSGSDHVPTHVLVMFDDVRTLPQADSTAWRFHRADGTEKADSVTAWSATRTLAPGNITRHTWDYKTVQLDSYSDPTALDQGELGNQCAASLTDTLVEAPHIGEDSADFQYLTRLRIQNHEYESKKFYAESDQRTACVGASFSLTGHAEIDAHPAEEREFVITELHVTAENNVHPDLSDKARRLFARNGWDTASATGFDPAALEQASGERNARYSNRLTCVRRGIPIVPSYDPRTDLPAVHPMSAIVVAGDAEGDEILCNELGCVKVRFPGYTIEAGSRTDTRGGDSIAHSTVPGSAWLRVATPFAGEGYGMIALPRAGDEVTVLFLNGNCDKPIIVGSAFNGRALPPRFSRQGSLPGNKSLSGFLSQELQGTRHNQLRLDDTNGQISAQLASEHGNTELNLGYLTHSRADGKAEPRGEGFEVASEAAGALRACSLLLTAEQQKGGSGPQLMREAIIQVLTAALDQVQRQGDHAGEVEANLPETGRDNMLVEEDSKPGAKTDAGHQTQLKEAVDNLERGWNTDPKGSSGQGGQRGKQGILMLGSTDGTALTSQGSVTMAANTNLDQVAQRDTNQTTGRRWIHNVGESASLFIDGGKAKIKYTFKTTVAKGDMLQRVLAGKYEVESNGDIVFKTRGKYIIEAEQGVWIKGEGGLIHVGNRIDIHNPGALSLKAADFDLAGPASSSTSLTLPTGTAKPCKMKLSGASHAGAAFVER
ncbi:type VI secretion system tip protein TssI/VgrG [Pseudoduganella sp. R-43]|uniref:type VI secretion system tip protein TssI/VgrG n=1 Tax=Pseudoduganella sp. R-43 TaxID=3404063 RepID=UPI003CF32101